jgi:hypothetical protein
MKAIFQQPRVLLSLLGRISLAGARQCVPAALRARMAAAGGAGADGGGASGVPLRGVVAYVHVRADDGLNASGVFGRRLAELGAVVVERLARGVTHCVFKGDADALRSLHDRAAKLPPPAPAVLAVSWVAACGAEGGSRAPEARHALPRPKDTLASLLVSPQAHARASAGKARKSMVPQPARKYGAPAARAAAGACLLAGTLLTHKRSFANAFAQISTWTTPLSPPRSA